jgi:hypothetical protein
MRSSRIVLALVVCGLGVSGAGAAEPAKPAVKVEFRWVESKYIEGVTEKNGFQSSCDPKSVVYPHKKPALVLTPADVTGVTMKQLGAFPGGVPSEHYMVDFALTKKARDALIAACGPERARELTITIDGRNWGVHRYDRTENKLVPEQCRAATFAPGVGFFSSKAEAQRLVDAFK